MRTIIINYWNKIIVIINLTIIVQPYVWLLNLIGAFVCDRILGAQLVCPTDEGFQWYATPAHTPIPSSGGQSKEITANEWVQFVDVHVWNYKCSVVSFSSHYVCVAGCVCRVGGLFCVGPLWRWPTLVSRPAVTMEMSCPGWLRPRGW